MSEWKKVKIDFDTIKLGDFIEPIKTTVLELGEKNPIVYGVTNKEGIVQTGKPASKDISNYIALEDDCFAFNPYRVNVGSIGINDKKLKGCVSPAYVVFRTKNGLLPKFLYFYLKSDYGIHLINWYGNRGGVRNALRYSDLCNIDIPNINHLDQQKILKKFLSASDKIDEISKEIESQKNYIKQLRQNILQDAIEGKLTADWRKQNPVQKGNPDYDAEALFKQIQKERNNEKKQKELSPITDEEKPFEIPKEWKWVRLGEICNSITDGDHLPPPKQNSGIPFIVISDVSSGVIDFKGNRYVPESYYEKLQSDKKPQKGDILYTVTGSYGIPVFVNDLKFCVQRHIGIIKPFQQIKNFIYYFLQSPICKKQADSVAWGVAVKTIPIKELRNFTVPLPPLKEQEEIVNKVETLLAKVTTLEKQIQDRKSLSDKLIFGIIKENLEGK